MKAAEAAKSKAPGKPKTAARGHAGHLTAASIVTAMQAPAPDLILGSLNDLTQLLVELPRRPRRPLDPERLVCARTRQKGELR